MKFQEDARFTGVRSPPIPMGAYYQPVFTKNQTFQGWFWLDQKVLSASVPVVYSNWKTGRPLDSSSKQWVAIFGEKASQESGNYPGDWKDFSDDNQFNFVCEVRCLLGESDDDELLLDFSGEVRSYYNGDPVADGIAVIPVLPSRFGVNVTAVYDDTNSYYNYFGYPIMLGYYYACENGIKNDDSNYGPKILWYNEGQ